QMRVEQDRIEKTIARNSDLLVQIRKNAVDNEAKTLLATFEQARPAYTSSMKKAIVLAMTSEHDAFRNVLLTEVRT
ncbi:MCP four helix bundle domain-containing protein, partial [Pectobacterium versatile]|uniref:MCP four helix bundle domain-containing protein n=1 Tax=Pectobacterium versatile TaxID=2488639 RepID=UPI001FFDB24E